MNVEDLLKELAGLARVLGWTDDTTYLQMINSLHDLLAGKR